MAAEQTSIYVILSKGAARALRRQAFIEDREKEIALRYGGPGVPTRWRAACFSVSPSLGLVSRRE